MQERKIETERVSAMKQ